MKHYFICPADGVYNIVKNKVEVAIIPCSEGSEIELNPDEEINLLGSSGKKITPPVDEPIGTCSGCSRKFDLPKNLKGAQRFIPIHVELFSSRCLGSGQPPKQ